MAARILSGGPKPIPDRPIMQEMIDSFKKHGDKVFMIEARTKKESTYRQTLENAGAFSSALRKLGQGPGKVVLILSDSCIEALTTIFGIWMSGAAFSAVNPDLLPDEILYYFNTCKCEVTFCGENYLGKVREVVALLDWNVTIICPNREDGVLDYYKCLKEGNSEEGIKLEGYYNGKDHAMGVLFTSGTTGSPKGVILRNEALTFNTHMRDHWKEDSILLLTTPMAWISNSLVLIVCGCVGAKIVIATKMSPKETMEAIVEFKPTDWFTGPSIVIDICNEEDVEKYDFSSLRALSIGGSALLHEHRKLITEKMTKNKHIVRSMYGSTEAGMTSYEKTIPDIDSPVAAGIGKVPEGVDVKVVDPETGKLLPPYAVGEICVRSAGLLKRYINKEITEQELDKDGFWHMGDLGYYDDEENLYYSSRLKDLMKYRGHHIAPSELENILQRHPDVLESCVVSKLCIDQGGDLPAAFVIKRSGSTLTEEELHNYISDKVIDEKKLRGGIFFVESLPKNSVGKVLRRELKKLLT